MTLPSIAPRAPRRLRRSPLTTSLALGVLAFGLLTSQPSRATSWELNPAVWLNSILTQANTWTQQLESTAAYLKQAQDIKNQYDHIKAQMTRLQTALLLAGFQGDQFTEVDELDGMLQACPGTQPQLLSIVQLSTPNLTGQDVVAKQLELCQRIQLAKNRKYNLTVGLMKRLNALGTEYQRLESTRMRVASDKQGELNGALANLQSFSAKFDQEMQSYDMRVKTYDNYIAALNDRQQLLARQALESKSGPLGTVMQGVVLKGALQAARSRDR